MTFRHTRGNAFGSGLLTLTLVAGLLLSCLVGCDNTEVQTIIWEGLNDLSVALVDALFQAIKPGTDNGQPVTVSWLAAPTPLAHLA